MAEHEITLGEVVDRNNNRIWARVDGRIFIFGNDKFRETEREWTHMRSLLKHYEGEVPPEDVRGMRAADPEAPWNNEPASDPVYVQIVAGCNGAVIGDKMEITPNTTARQLTMACNALVISSGMYEGLDFPDNHEFFFLRASDEEGMEMSLGFGYSSVYRMMTQFDSWKHQPLYVTPWHSAVIIVFDLENFKRQVMVSKYTSVERFKRDCLMWYTDRQDMDITRIQFSVQYSEAGRFRETPFQPSFRDDMMLLSCLNINPRQKMVVAWESSFHVPHAVRMYLQ